MSKIAMIFPGIGYHCDKPLLYYGKKLAVEMGYQIVEVAYSGFEMDIRGNEEKMKTAAKHALVQAEAILNKLDFSSSDDILCISKSVGTVVAAAWQKKKRIIAKNVFFTPLEATFEYAAYNSGIVFYGTKDPWVTTEIIRAGCERLHLPLFIIKDGNHSLECGMTYIDMVTVTGAVGNLQKYMMGQDMWKFADNEKAEEMIQSGSEIQVNHPLDTKYIQCNGEGTYIGVDGCKGGWIAAILNNYDLRIEKYQTVNELIESYPLFDRLFIDMVIGLPSSNQDVRPDSIARKMLAPRTSTVFPVPCRQAVYEEKEEEQIEANCIHLGKKLAKQSLAIIPKIRELDEFLKNHNEYKNVFKESHPELCFSRLAGKVLLSKKSELFGYTERQNILSKYLGEVAHINIWELSKKLRCKPDDIVDALCLLVTANLDAQGLTMIIPENPQKDVNDLFMQMTIPIAIF